MILISHRGNINKIDRKKENSQSYIQEAIDLGYEVEIDIWLHNKCLYLGHDNPTYKVDLNWLEKRKKHLWIHCKNFQALSYLINSNLRIFYHLQEDYTIISDKHIWAHNLSLVNSKCIIPLLSKKEITEWEITDVYGVCSDFIEVLKDRLIKN